MFKLMGGVVVQESCSRLWGGGGGLGARAMLKLREGVERQKLC